MHQKQIPCSLGVRHCDIYEQGSSWEATSTWGPSLEYLCIIEMCSKVFGFGHCPIWEPCTHLPPFLSIPDPDFPLCTSCSGTSALCPPAPVMNPAATLRPGPEGFLCSSSAPQETVCLNPKCHRVTVTGPAPWSLTAVPSPHPCLRALGEPHVPVPRHSLRTRFRISLRSCPEQS